MKERDVRNSKVGQQLMKDARSMKSQFNRDYKISVDEENPADISQWEIVGRSHSYNQGYIKFNGVEGFQISISGNSFLSYAELTRKLERDAEHIELNIEEQRRAEESLT